MEANLYIPDARTGCWNWRGSLHPKGYGRYFDGTAQRPAHRLMYEAHVGPIPEGAQVRHTCGNKRCVRPAHLRLVLPTRPPEIVQKYTCCTCQRDLPDTSFRPSRLEGAARHRMCKVCEKKARRI